MTARDLELTLPTAALASRNVRMTDRISFGDTVTVRAVAETEAARIAGKTGTVYGYTTPSSTGVHVVGALQRDHAVNVYFDDLRESFWLPEELLVFVDHRAGIRVSISGVNKEWIRKTDGSWEEATALTPRPIKRPWWRFWA
jgi:hypothetical protein